MAPLRRFLSRLHAFFRSGRIEQELTREITAHVTLMEDDFQRRGMTPAQSRIAARRAFGGLDQAKERQRDARSFLWLEDSRRDLWYAVRTLSRHWGFSVVAIVMLAVGIGANTAIFSVLQATSLGASAFPEPNRLLLIWSTTAARPDTNDSLRIVEYQAWKEQGRAFDHLGTALGWSSTVGAAEDGSPADRLSGWRFTASLFAALGVQPQIGRLISEDDDRVDGPSNVAVISDSLWQRRFGRDPAVLNRTLLLDGSATSIIGVMPASFRFFTPESDFWIPMNFTRFQLQARSPNRVLMVLGHLRPGVSLSQAQLDADALASQLAKVDPLEKGRGVRLQPLDDAFFGNVRQLLRVLQGAVGFVLLIACANVAGLLLIRGASQRKEVTIRCAIGASRFRIVRQLLTESVVLSLAGGILGVGLAWGGLRLLVAATPSWLSLSGDLRIDTQVLLFSATISVLTGLAFGVAPAMRLSPIDLVASLKESARAAAGREHRRLQGTLVVAQVALTVVLLVGAGLLIKSFWHLQRTPLGFEPGGLLAFQTRLPANKYFKQVGVENGFTKLDVSPVPAMLFDRVARRLAQVPGVQSAAGVDIPPASGGALSAPITIEGQPAIDAAGAPVAHSANYWLVTPNYFATMRIPIVRGREFTADDTATSVRMAIINETMARQFWPNENPLGKRLSVTIVPNDGPREIVGVVGDTSVGQWNRTPVPTLYIPQLQESLRYRTPYGQTRVQMTFLLRLSEPAAAVIPSVRRAVADIDPALPVVQLQLLQDSLNRQIEAPRDSMVAVGAFAMVALFLAVFGISGVVAYAVVQRTHEIGIRMALGATSGEIVRLVAGHSCVLTLSGLALGLSAAAMVTRYLRTLLFGLTPLDPITFVAAGLAFAVVAAIAAYAPARRAAAVDPLVALRCE